MVVQEFLTPAIRTGARLVYTLPFDIRQLAAGVAPSLVLRVAVPDLSVGVAKLPTVARTGPVARRRVLVRLKPSLS